MSKSNLTALHIVLGFKPGNVPERCALAASVGSMCPTSAIYAADPAVKAAADIVKQKGLALATDEQDFENAAKAESDARTQRNGTVFSFDQSVNVLVAAVENAAKTPADVSGIGMKLRSPPVKATLVQVTKLTVKPGALKQTIDIHATRIKGLNEYKTQISVDPITPTSFVDLVGSMARRTVGGLVSGTRYWVRVCAVQGDQLGAWSDPVAVIVP